ncbi:serine hydrolase [Arthrobacter sp. JCM 19049]|nr:serine hydrolase [Arthrobacter sp. JCM 19049]
MGTLMEELVRRVSGQELQQIFEQRIRRPLGVDATSASPPSWSRASAPP